MSARFELMRSRVNLDQKATVGLVADSVDMVAAEIGKLTRRVADLEAEAAKPRPPVMVYAGEWVPGAEYDPGNVVEFDGAVLVCVQPRNPQEPPSRFTGWAQLPMGA